MAISSNFPTIRPSLNLDFANVKALDPRITFSRASTAAYYDGVTTAKAEENLLRQSEDFTTTWGTSSTTVSANTEVAPDGTTTADTLTATAANARIYQSVTYGDGGDATFSVWLKRKTGTGDIEISHTIFSSATVVAVTNNWQRFSVTTTLSSGSRTVGIEIVTSGDEVYAWGAQLEIRSTATSYTPTTTQPITNYIPVLQTAASDVARFDHNPTTGEGLGLLMEEQRTNLILRSEEFDNASWTKTNSSITANTIVAPDGTLTGDALVENTSNSSHEIRQDVTVVANTTYTTSFYLKAFPTGSQRFPRVQVSNTGVTNGVRALFDLSTGTISVAAANFGSGTGASATITSVGDGWYRCTLSGIIDNSSTTARVLIFMQSVGNSYSAVYTGDGYSSIYIWGAQLEAGAFPTSYVPTTSASVTRAADVANMTGTNFSSWFNNAEGAITLDYKTSGQTTVLRVASVSDGTPSDKMEFAIASAGGNGPYLFVVANGANQVATSSGTYASNTNYKWAAAYEINNYAWSKDGGAVVSDTDALVPVVNQLQIAQDATGAIKFNGHIRKISYYPQRLTNAQLQALTT